MKYPLPVLTLFFATQIELFAQENQSMQTAYGFFLAAFVFGAIGITSFLLSSYKLKKIKEQTRRSEGSADLEMQQNQLLSTMSENIYKMVKQAVGNTSAIASKVVKEDLNKELCSVIQTENQLLDLANDLIEFLHLKAKKVTIHHNNYKLDNLLNDLTGFISKNFHAKAIQLSFHIDKNIPSELTGDTLKISKVLYNLLDYSIRKGANDIVLKTSKSAGFQSTNELTFLIHTNLHLDVEKDPFFFKTHYDEKSNSYDSLGLFVAKELAALMQGELIARNDAQGRLEFLFSMVFHAPNNGRKQTIAPQLLHKNVLIVDHNARYGLALKEMLEVYAHKVFVLRPEEFLTKPQDLSCYDIIALDEKLFTASIVKSLEKLEKRNGLKIIALSNFFNPIDAKYYTKVANLKLLKPTTPGTLLRALETFYLPQQHKKTPTHQRATTSRLKIYTNSFANTPDVSIENFVLFKGLRLLIVEDDVINQKVLQGVLKRSEMLIDVANNGEECLKLLEKNKHYDMILMDINMPVIDGYTATQKIRQNSAYDTIAIIALTALTSPDEIHKMFDVGMNGHLAKPLHKEQLFTAFDMFLQQTNEDLKPTQRQTTKQTHYEGLDIEKGIARANNNEDFYKEILEEFLNTYRKSPEIFEKLIYDFRYEQIRMLCLDIKGLAGLIGATELHALMNEIHQQLIFKKFDLLSDYTQAFYQKIEILNKTIEKYIQN